MDAGTVIGAIAAVCTTLSNLPQLKKCWETGSAGDLSLRMLLLHSTGVALWIGYGVFRGDWIIIGAIARVLRAWGDFEGDTWAGGFVMELLDGRRVYVESYADAPDWGPDSCASVVAVPIDSTLPKLPRNRLRTLWLDRRPSRARRLLEAIGLAGRYCPGRWVILNVGCNLDGVPNTTVFTKRYGEASAGEG
jgi:MtN3 and saliva related transmembrane protein